jgi:hypothetical protein
MATSTKSRAQRAADQAKADQDQPSANAERQPGAESPDQDKQPERSANAEPEQPGPAEDQDEDEADDQEDEEPEPEAKPTEPYATVTGAEVHIPVYRGVVKVTAADGEVIETIECECRWAHTTPEIAERCGRKLAVKRGLRIGAK